jgi:hypothetical protein
VGRCYDLLHADPLSFELSAMTKMAFEADNFEPIKDKSASKPIGIEHAPKSGGDYEHKVWSVSSSYDFQTMFREDGTLTVSDPVGKLFNCSLSQSFTSMRQSTEGHENVVTYTGERT